MSARYRHFLEETRWDVVIIDEAHNVAGASAPERHLSHRLARQLSRRTDSLVLTTATPHNGKRATFGRLDPSAIPDPKFEEYDLAFRKLAKSHRDLIGHYGRRRLHPRERPLHSEP